MERYEIRVVGHVGSRRASALGSEALRLLPDGQSVLTVAARDQADLYGLLSRLCDLGIELVSVTPAAHSRRADEID